MAIEPIKGFYVHDEETNTDGVAKYDYGSLENKPAFEVNSVYPLSDWRNGWIRDTDSIGTIGSATRNLVAGYNGAYATLQGDGHTYDVVLASGWELTSVGEYDDKRTGSFVQFLDLTDNTVTLTEGKYYIFQIGKVPETAVSPSDVEDDTIILKYSVFTDVTLSKSGKAADAEAVGNFLEKYHGTNWLDPVEIAETSGKYVNASGTVGNSASYAYTLSYIPVNEGDVIFLAENGIITDAQFRYVVAYDSEKTVMTSAGMSTAGRTYTVPADVSYIRCTIFLADFNRGNLAININTAVPYSTYFSGKVPMQKGKNDDRLTMLENLPLTAMPEYIRNILAYRPLGKLNKGYMCLVTDDGKEGMVSYTIPMVIEKEVPCTFAVMSNSECFATAARIEAVVDAVENHGCAISQHGGRNWTEYSEYGLNKFFDTEKAFFDSLDLSVNSAVIPSHYTTPLVQSVAGGRFGVVRSGYMGYDADGNYGETIHNYFDYYTSGEGSNLFGLSSYNLSGRTLDQNKAAIDYAYDNNKIMIVYWHENALDADKKAIMEGSIDYAKTKGLEFITLDQIPYLNDGEITF